jgi:hypothetical protein
MKQIREHIHGYDYGEPSLVSPVSVEELASLKVSVGFTEEDERYLRLAGEVLTDRTKQVVDEWRNSIIVGIPSLARHSRTLDGKPIPVYATSSGLRFEQWILDTCTPYVPLRDIIAFIAVMNETIKPHLAAKGHSTQEVERMHSAWCKSIQLQTALWVRAYGSLGLSEW